MARVKLDLPERFSSSTELTVRIADINYGQHLGNDAGLAFFDYAKKKIAKMPERFKAALAPA